MKLVEIAFIWKAICSVEKKRRIEIQSNWTTTYLFRNLLIWSSILNCNHRLLKLMLPSGKRSSLPTWTNVRSWSINPLEGRKKKHSKWVRSESSLRHTRDRMEGEKRMKERQTVGVQDVTWSDLFPFLPPFTSLWWAAARHQKGNVHQLIWLL